MASCSLAAHLAGCGLAAKENSTHPAAVRQPRDVEGGGVIHWDNGSGGGSASRQGAALGGRAHPKPSLPGRSHSSQRSCEMHPRNYTRHSQLRFGKLQFGNDSWTVGTHKGTPSLRFGNQGTHGDNRMDLRELMAHIRTGCELSAQAFGTAGAASGAASTLAFLPLPEKAWLSRACRGLAQAAGALT